jgi:hypothetical protein
MGQGLGYNSFFGWAKETTYNTPVAAAKWLEIESEAIKNQRKFEPIQVLGSVDQVRRMKSPKKVGGSIKFPALWTGWEQLLEAAMGTVSTSGTGPYTHAFSLGDPLPTGLTAYVNRDVSNVGAGSEARYAGCKVNKLTIGCEYGKPMMVDVELVGSGDFSHLAASSPVYPTFDPIEYSQMTEALINPASLSFVLKIRKWQITIDNSLTEMRRLGNASAGAIVRGDKRKINWEFEAEFDSLALWQYFSDLPDTNTDMRFKWVKDANTEISFVLPKTTFDGQDPEAKDNGPIYVPFSGTSWNAQPGVPLTISWKNSTVSV